MCCAEWRHSFTGCQWPVLSISAHYTFVFLWKQGWLLWGVGALLTMVSQLQHYQCFVRNFLNTVTADNYYEHRTDTVHSGNCYSTAPSKHYKVTQARKASLTQCILNCSGTCICMNVKQQRLWPCSCYIPTDINGTACQGMHKTTVNPPFAERGPLLAYALACPVWMKP